MTDNIQNGEGVGIFDRLVRLVDGGSPEPTLRDILFMYYRAYFSEFEALGFSDQYIASLAREPATADVERLIARLGVEHCYLAPSDVQEARRLLATRAAPSSEPAIAEGEVTKADRDLFACLCPDMASLIYGGDLDRFRQMQAIVRFRLAQSSTPPASKGVEKRSDADLLRLIAQDHARLAPNAYHSAATLLQIADRLDAPTPSNDTLQGRGEVEDAVTVLDVFLAAYRKQPDAELVKRKANDDLLTWGDLRVLLAALQKDTRHGG